MFFYAGGHGPMFDLPENQEIAKLCTKAYEGGAVVCAVCHGTVDKTAHACKCTMCGYHMLYLLYLRCRHITFYEEKNTSVATSPFHNVSITFVSVWQIDT